MGMKIKVSIWCYISKPFARKGKNAQVHGFEGSRNNSNYEDMIALYHHHIKRAKRINS